MSENRRILMLATISLVLAVASLVDWLMGATVPVLGFSIAFGILFVFLALLLVRRKNVK